MSTSNDDDMQPVTRKELREDLVALEVKFDTKLSMLVGALLDAIKQSGEQLMLAFGQRLTRELGASEQRLTRELGQRLTIELGATEQRLMGEVGASEQRMKLELGATEQRLMGEVGATEQRLMGEVGASEQRMKLELGATEQRLMGELGSHTRASTEELTARVAVIDDQYQDLPARVARLETITPAPKRRARKS